MKSFLALFIAVFGLSTIASAHKGHHHYNPYTTTVNHDYKSILGQISLHNACVHGDAIYSRKNVKVCTNLVAKETKSHGEVAPSIDWVCSSYEMKPLSVSRNFVTSYCTATTRGVGEAMPECVAWSKRDGRIPDTINIQIVTNRAGEVFQETKETTFTFPGCTAAELEAHSK